MNGLVTLLTDFGEVDTYVGQVKGALLTVLPTVRWVDLTHLVPPQDVAAGAFLLWSAVETFPKGTVHLAVVDPGVGSERRAVAALSAAGHYFVGPDNGLLMPAIKRMGGLVAAVELTDATFWGAGRSTTFHGRDRFSPVAGHLAKGVPLEKLGRALDKLETPLSFEPPRKEGKLLWGEVLHVDVYGNLITNLPAELLPPRFELRVGAIAIADAPHANYQSVAEGELLALVGSAGLLEISARDASAATRLGVGRGTRILVTPH